MELFVNNVNAQLREAKIELKFQLDITGGRVAHLVVICNLQPKIRLCYQFILKACTNRRFLWKYTVA